MSEWGSTYLTALFGPLPKKPTTPGLPVAPLVTDAGVQAAAEKLRRDAAQAFGRGSTILTSPLGVMQAPSLGKKTLLGM